MNKIKIVLLAESPPAMSDNVDIGEVKYFYNTECVSGSLLLETAKVILDNNELAIRKKEDKIINTSNVEQDPAVLYRERMKKEADSEAELIEAAKKAEREAYAQQAAMGSSIVEEDDEDEGNWDSYDILPTMI